jgi:hypothetical protein
MLRFGIFLDFLGNVSRPQIMIISLSYTSKQPLIIFHVQGIGYYPQR